MRARVHVALSELAGAEAAATGPAADRVVVDVDQPQEDSPGEHLLLRGQFRVDLLGALLHGAGDTTGGQVVGDREGAATGPLPGAEQRVREQRQRARIGRRAGGARSEVGEENTDEFVGHGGTGLLGRGDDDLLQVRVGQRSDDERTRREDKTVAIVRLEQLYPLAETELVEVFKGYPNLKEIFWVQEEPKNMGAWFFMFPHLQQMVSQIHKTLTVGYIGRVEAASPATGLAKVHQQQQEALVRAALDL